jgi:hypothetical protein
MSDDAACERQPFMEHRTASATRALGTLSGSFPTRPERFELPTFGSVDRRSIQLS